MDDYKIWTNDEGKWPLRQFAGVADKIHRLQKNLVLIVDSGIRAETGYGTYDRLLESNVFIRDDQTGGPHFGKVWVRSSLVKLSIFRPLSVPAQPLCNFLSFGLNSLH